MKKPFLIPAVQSAAPAISQSSGGISFDHLSVKHANMQEQTTRSNNDLTTQRIALRTGVTLDYVEKGSATGVPVIFLHGITDSWHSFESVLALLPPSIRGFALTQRGHGDSERPAEGYTPAHFAADVAAFIQQKELGKAIVVGHSMGGVHTLQFAIDYPHLAKAIVIIDSDPYPHDNPGMEEFLQEVMKLEGTISWQFMDDFQAATLARPIDSNYYHVLVSEGTKTPVKVFQAAFKGLLEVNLTSRLKDIQCPTLLFWGDKDAFFFRKGQELLQENLPESQLIVYEGVGHALHWENPGRFVADLQEFILLNRLDRR